MLANDQDVDGDMLEASLDTGPANGTLSLNADGSFVYTPADGFVGGDQFTYVASDGELATSAVTVNITVSEDGGSNGDNDAPIATNDTYNVLIDGNLAVTAENGLLDNDSDPNGDPLTVSLVTGPNSGTLVLEDDGSFTYSPDAGFLGIDGFSYLASDGELVSDVVTVTINVLADNNAPIARNDSYTVEQEQTLEVQSANGLLVNDEDADGDSLSVSLFSGTSNGALTLNDDGSFTYTPNSGFVGTDSFVYQVDDQLSVSNLAAVTLHVTSSPANAAPLTIDPELALSGPGDQLTLEIAASQVMLGIDIWSAARPDLADTFGTVYIGIEDLPQGRLGQTIGNRIILDDDAWGMGWGVTDDIDAPAIPDRIDLLSVVLHELGHVAGLPDLPVSEETEDVMEALISAGVRRTPAPLAVDDLMADDDWLS